ncbi:nucleotide exchange factor GrpE [Virgibacillus halophilus]|uniref:nucleotide exchange factor GrpE n=1 Tax=Tigheibacillus halophilus TaxID=361280 RepID=UPI00363C6AED
MEELEKEETKEEMKKNTEESVETPQENQNESVNAESEQDGGDAAELNATEQELETEMEQLREDKEKLFDQLARIQAEYDNFKKRTQKEKQASQKYKAQDLVTALLPVMDNFERALKTQVSNEAAGFMEGMNMVYRQLLEALKNEGLSEIETVGKEFDPNMHHAVMQAEDENYESNIIVEELQKGYLLKDRVIRPAMVKVNK